MVFGTRTSRVVGVHGGDGRIIWARNVPMLSSTVKVLPWTNMQTNQEDESPELLIVGKSHDAGAILIWLKAHTGDIIKTQVVDYKIRHILNVPNETTLSPSEYLAIDNDMKVHHIGDNNVMKFKDDSTLNRMHLFDVDASMGILRGFRLYHHGSALYLKETWRQATPMQWKVVAVVQHHQDESTFSRSRVMGDRSFRLKYLNKNTALVALESSPLTSDESATAFVPQLQMMLIDTVSGRVLHSVLHESSRGPVNAVLCENWAAYHFWNEKLNRFEISSLELFTEAEPGEDISVQNMLAKSIWPASINDTMVRN